MATTRTNPWDDAWLLVIDPQAIFADPSSPWAAPRFDEALTVTARLAPRFDGRVIVTRWVPSPPHRGSWQAYFERWPFADRPADDRLFALMPQARGLSARPTLDCPTFSKWGPELCAAVGDATPHLVLTGCATDCCVLATALAAADAGASVDVVAAGCAGSSDENHAAAVHLLGLYEPQIRIVSSDAFISSRADAA